jgi:phage gp16-like protein
MTARTQYTDQRARLIKLIHVAKRELGMDEPTYRAMLLASGGTESTAMMDAPTLERVLAHLKRSGFKVRHKATPPAARSRALDTRDQARKVRALWLLLYVLGVVRNPSEASLAAYVKRITGDDALQWVHGDKLDRLIETMKQWSMRYLPAINERLREDAIARAGAGTLTPLNLAHVSAANALRGEKNTDTFNVQWEIWVHWRQALYGGLDGVPAKLPISPRWWGA